MNEPYEIFDIGDGESVTLTILRHEKGTMTIHPAYAPEGKEVTVLRLHLKTPVRPGAMDYLDITSKKLIAKLEPRLADYERDRRAIKITKLGVAPKADFIVLELPLTP